MGTIVPYDFFENPEALGDHTRGLFERELVKPISPGSYIYDIPAFDSAFADYLGSPAIDSDKRRRRFEEGHTFQIHMEKLGPIEDLLIESGLAHCTNYPWFSVECDTATEFMAYLASCLGKIPEINSMPVTDEKANIQIFIDSERDQNQPINELNCLRMEVLERVFPAPNHSLAAAEIEDFKGKHGDKLRGFRRAVEKEIIELAQIDNPALRKRRMDLFEDEIKEISEDLNARFREGGFLDVVFGKLCPLLGAIPGASSVFGLANAVYSAFGGVPPKLESPLAYAAYAQVDLISPENQV